MTELRVVPNTLSPEVKWRELDNAIQNQPMAFIQAYGCTPTPYTT